jgi:16S rRNA (uracil1498-N3)-methyltransferase
MERYFASVKEGVASLSEESAHHLRDVMRGRSGETIEIVSEGKVYEAMIASVKPLKITIQKEIETASELPRHLILAFSLLKGGHDELVLMKGTELGVGAFAPFVSSRTIIRLEKGEGEKRRSRYEKIVIGAAEQSKRTMIPEVNPIRNYRDILEIKADHRYLAYEGKSLGSFELRGMFSSLGKEETVLAVVGPEGGFSGEEADLARAKGFEEISLGKRILRAETASLYLASVFAFLSEGGK